MSDERVLRRLVAILAADVVNYSSHIRRDEAGTRARFNEVLDQIIMPTLAQHRGRLFKTKGDGFLAEFASVVDAVDRAVDIQQQMREHAGGTHPLQLRIGVNLGDVIVEGDDLHGDGVNVAARLEGLAPPGGVCISRSARDQVRDKLAYQIEDMGEIEVKNIARPVRAFQVSSGPAEVGASLDTVTTLQAPVRGKRRLLPVNAGLVVLVIAVAGIALWLEPWAQRVEATSIADMKLPLPDKPSVAVLPFDLGSAGEGDWQFADAVNEDLTRGLARVSGLFVIARSSTLQFVGANVSPAVVAQELGVRHVVRATLRRAGDRVRIDAELADTISGRIIWSDRFDRASADLFVLQDELVQALTTRLAEDLTRRVGQERFTNDVDAYFAWFKGDRESWINTPAAYGKARALALSALERDPGFVRAKALLAFVDTRSGYFKVATDPPAALTRGLEAAAAAAEEQPGDWYAQAVYAQAIMNLRDYEAAVLAFGRAIELDPSNASLLTRSTLPLIFLGRGQEAEARLRVAIRLNPYLNWLADQLLGQSLFLLGRYEDALKSLAIARQKNERFVGNMWWRAAAYGQLGQLEEAGQAVSEILSAMPRAIISTSFIQIKHDDAMERFRSGLRAAGLPE